MNPCIYITIHINGSCYLTVCYDIILLFCCKDNVWPESERKKNPEEPSYVQSEKDQFRDYRDKDKDGKLNKVYTYMNKESDILL